MFAIYLGRMFKQVKDDIERCMTTLFLNDYWWLVTTDSVPQLCGMREMTVVKKVVWKSQNYVAVDKAEDQMITFTRRSKLQLKRRIANTRITVP